MAIHSEGEDMDVEDEQRPRDDNYEAEAGEAEEEDEEEGMTEEEEVLLLQLPADLRQGLGPRDRRELLAFKKSHNEVIRARHAICSLFMPDNTPCRCLCVCA
jgi:hypothetical protein